MRTNTIQSNRLPRGGIALRRRLLPALIAGCFGSGLAVANPLGPQVVSGQVSFSTQGNTLSVINSPGSVINWQSFSIGAGETTRFIQQNSDSSVLNRIGGQDPTQIFGALQSNGKVFLVNPNGILFGAGAQVDVNGLVASTLDISNEDFINGRMIFKAGDKAGKLTNLGAITTPAGGKVYLIAPNVENSGLIVSPGGEVMLAAGHSVNLVDSMNPALQVAVSAPDDAAVNIGEIVAQGGKAGIFGALVSQRGVVSADSATVGENGKIVFRASRMLDVAAGSRTSANAVGGQGGDILLQSDGTTLVGGDIAARGAGVGGKGGNISILGREAGVIGQATVDASGTAGGGTVLVGGDYQGKGAVPNAEFAYTGDQASIRADAGNDGNGGKVIVWSDNTTRSYAHISARGGAEGGNGGFVETSGKKHLDVGNAYPDVRAPKGQAGSWLLDPDDVTIAASGESNISTGPDFTPLGTGSVLSAATLKSFLETSGTVTIDTSGAGSGAGDINVNAPINVTLASAGALRLRAHNNINVNAPITAGGSTLDVDLFADIDDNGSGGIKLNSTIDSNGGAVWLSGNSVELTSAGVINAANGVVDIAARQAGNGSVVLAAGSQVNAAGGYIGLLGDNMTLDGVVDAVGATGSGHVRIETESSTRSIDLGTKTAGTLGLTAAELQNIKAEGLSVGNSESSGSIIVSAPVSFAASGLHNLMLETGGDIALNQKISLAAADGFIGLDSYGSLGGISVGAAGGLATTGYGSFISLTADRMDLAGSAGSINAGGGSVFITSASSGTAIKLGQGATDASGVLGLSDSELRTISAGGTLQVADYSSGTGGGISVVGPLDLTGGALTGNVLLYAGDGGVSVNQSFLVPNELNIFTSGKLTNQGHIGAGQSITMYADKMALAGGTIAGGWTTIMTGNGVDLGASDAPGVADMATGRLELSNAELNSISADVLQIISTSGDGIDVKGAISPSHIGQSMSLLSYGAITQQAGATIGGAPALNLVGASVDLHEANATGVIAGGALSGDFRYRSSNLLTVADLGIGSGLFLGGSISAPAATATGPSASSSSSSGYSVPSADYSLSTTAASSASMILESDSPYGINQYGNAGIVTSGGTLVLKTAGPVQLFSQSNMIDRLAANLNPAGAGTGNLDVYSGTSMEVTAAGGVSGITTNNNDVRLSTGAGKTLTIGQAVNAGTGDIDIEADNLVLNDTVTAAEASIRPYTDGRAITVGSGTCFISPCLAVTNLYRIAAPTIGIGREPDEGTSSVAVGPIHVAGISHTSLGTLTDRNDVTTRIGLLSAQGVTQSGAIDVHDLGVVAGGSVALDNAGNKVTELAARTLGGSFSFNNSQAFSVSNMTGEDYGLLGLITNGGNVSLATTGGNITMAANIEAGSGNIGLNSGGALVAGTGTVSGNSLDAQARSGISLTTKVASLSATNTDTTGSSAIGVQNAGMMVLRNVKQLGTGNGNISVTSNGGLAVASGYEVGTVGGNIALTALSPLTVDGNVKSTTGAITLQAGTGTSSADILTVNGNVSTAGSVTLKAGATIVVNGTVSGSPVTKTAGGGVPGIDSCVLNPSLPGCSTVSGTVQSVQTQTNAVSSTVIASSATTSSTGSSSLLTTSTVSKPATGSTSTSSNDDTAKSDGEEKKDETKLAGSNDSGAKKNESSKKMYCN